jgi:hypothetical protein
MMSDTVVVTPTFNEAGNIARLLDAVPTEIPLDQLSLFAVP